MKNEGIRHMQQTFGNTTEFISYVRGKSGVVEVFDTSKEEVVSSRNFSKCFEGKDSEIKGLIEYGDNLESLKHLVIDNNANVVFLSKPSKSNNLFKGLGEQVHCVARNPHK